MRLLIRADGDGRIGGGHIMRCLSLADAARAAGHEVTFLMIDAGGGMADWVRAAEHGLILMPTQSMPAQSAADAGGGGGAAGPDGYADWLRQPWQQDAERSALEALRVQADWVILDHYGIDRRWVAALRARVPEVRLMAFDDLDDRALGADLLLDQTRLGAAPRRHRALARLSGPHFALLRPEFAAARPAALARRGGEIGRILIAPGMMDAAGLAPLALDAVARWNVRTRAAPLRAEVVMGSASQSREAVEARAAQERDFCLTLDATDMAARMGAADLCIGAGGTTSWERCCLGLPTLTIAVSDNQRPGVAALAEAGAAVALSLEDARDPARLDAALAEAISRSATLAEAAAQICDGGGAARVVAALGGALRPLRADDAEQLFAWRNQPHIRAASLSADPLEWDSHAAWVARAAQREDAVYCIYSEAGRDLGLVSAVQRAQGDWHWSFYIGAAQAPKGAGGRMLAAFLRQMAARRDVQALTAEVLPQNTASLRLHETLGFTPTTAAPDSRALAFRLPTWDVRDRLALPAAN
ncbi:UDP-2,4-diacetamido-2,4,6-trideoxy-beta-L-altropyranose hydrolase [Litorivita sp. NS0012-18]|uniref:UDP-2,4-diacetamido-2,4, 6-trideoxy-beta-L-altropyranose hydrolase n=1 Tax=Litorivita sp. NS0012-18 TaxID=3127655 RepID=UPI00310B4E59